MVLVGKPESVSFANLKKTNRIGLFWKPGKNRICDPEGWMYVGGVREMCVASEEIKVKRNLTAKNKYFSPDQRNEGF